MISSNIFPSSYIYIYRIYFSWFDKYVIVFRRRALWSTKFLFRYGFITCTPVVSLSLFLSLSSSMHQKQSNATDATRCFSRRSYFLNIHVASCSWNADAFYSRGPFRKQYSRVTPRRLNKSYSCDY